MAEVEIKLSDVYSGDPRVPGPVLSALRDILAQPIQSRFARKIRKMTQRIQEEIDLVQELHQALLDKYTPVVDGKKQPVRKESDLTDAKAFNAEYADLLADTFTMEPIQMSVLEAMNLNLKGTTWGSVIIEDDEEPEETPSA